MPMPLRCLVLLLGIAVTLTGVNAQTAGRISPHETVSASIGGLNGPRVSITYGRPYTRDPNTGEMRRIFGGLVPYDRADRMGADEATTLITQQDLQFGDVRIPAGAYTLYWVLSDARPSLLAFSSNIGKWGIPLDESTDVARVELARSTLSEPINQLTITVENTPTGGLIRIRWETTQFVAEFAPVD